MKGEGSLLPEAIMSFERSATLIGGLKETADRNSIDFVMTNPPFYASEADMLESAKKKQRPPFSACTGGAMEMITPGGEVAFVSKLVEESTSVESRDRIQWFTSMLGKLTSVSIVVEQLRERHCTNYAVTEFVQGSKTRRWAVAWSWQDLRPSTTVARGIPGFEKKLLPFPADFEFGLLGIDIDVVGKNVCGILHSLEMEFQWKAALAKGVGLATGDVWSRKARRKRARDENEDQEMVSHEETDESPALAFKISLRKQTNTKGLNDTMVHLGWLQGRDAILFESFCGWLKRRLEIA
jgi:23S rRNA (adenine1618-N6)-methyltransferase